MTWEGADAEPGDWCGQCGDGRLRCDGPDALLCGFEGPLDVCGGCGPHDAVEGDSCGNACGTYGCVGDELICLSLVCL